MYRIPNIANTKIYPAIYYPNSVRTTLATAIRACTIVWQTRRATLQQCKNSEKICVYMVVYVFQKIERAFLEQKQRLHFLINRLSHMNSQVLPTTCITWIVHRRRQLSVYMPVLTFDMYLTVFQFHTTILRKSKFIWLHLFPEKKQFYFCSRNWTLTFL